MSFADEVRDELYEGIPKKPCCRRALAAGLLLGAEAEDKTVTARFPSEACTDYAEEVFRAQFGRGVTFARQPLPRGSRLAVFSSPAAVKLLHVMREQSDASERLTGGCEGCPSAFLHGAFLSAGTVNDPHRSIHLEFFLRVPAYLPLVTAVLAECGYPPRTVARENGTGLYYKDGTSVEDLLTLCGAGRVAMELMNVRFERQLRGEENRATNCLTKNISKTVTAAMRQVDAIRALRRSGRLSGLPAGVQETAALREENPEVSLEELCALHTPPITKSGLNHRLKRLLEEAEGCAKGGF